MKKSEEKLEKLQENVERLRKCSYFARPGGRGRLRPCLHEHPAKCTLS